MPSLLGSGEPPSPQSPTAEDSPTRRIVVAHCLPLCATPDPSSPHGFAFSLDPDALSLQVAAGLPRPVVFVGVLPPSAAAASPTEELAADLLAEFSCLPVFLSEDLHARFYDGFCKHYLWPLLHYLLPMSPVTLGDPRFDSALYRSYLTANKHFADRVLEVFVPDRGDIVLAHDYHLWALPTFLRHKCPRVRLGFFLHSPFPSSELFRTIPVRDDLVRALLNADLVGFHTFDYARHFLSCCSRLLGLSNRPRRGHIAIEYYGRDVVVKILAVGIDMGQLRANVSSPEAAAKAEEIANQYKGRLLMLGVDDIDLFKGIGLKLLAMEHLLDTRPDLRGRAVLIQIVNPARSLGRDVEEVREETRVIRERINARFGLPGYEPVVLIDRQVTMREKVAFYAAAECCVVNPVRDGLNRTPYFYTACRQEGPVVNGGATAPRKSVIVLSEFVGCSPSLSGAIRVNPWSVEAVADAMHSALGMSDTEKKLRHEKHYKYVSSHDIAFWSRSIDLALQRACTDDLSMRSWGVGLGMSFRIVALGPSFKKLLPEHIIPAYRRAGSRLIMLDYDGTMTPDGLIDKTPSTEVIRVLNGLCSDPRNTVFVVSGRGKDELAKWFAPCEKMGISAEHGYFTRWNRDSSWESCKLVVDFDWKEIVQPVMMHYTEATDGSYIEVKETAVVWHYQDADRDFGSCQAKELLDHLENVLANEPVCVKSGHLIVEVNPQGVGKGVAVKNLLATIASHGNTPNFILCVGDDRSDEDMFKSIVSPTGNASLSANAKIFACTVGNKPSVAEYYLDDPEDVLSMLEGLARLRPEQSASSQRLVRVERFTLSDASVE